MIYLSTTRGRGRVAVGGDLAPRERRGRRHDLAAEVLDLFPGATVRIVRAPDPVPSCDLLISVFSAPWRFPLHDAVYEGLEQLEGLLRYRPVARRVMIYGASWRSVEVVPSEALAGFVRKRRMEAWLIRLLGRSRLLRRLLRPFYA
jgi:hypothetical protein